MPHPRHALIDIGEEYYETLREMQSQLEMPGSPTITFTQLRHQFGHFTDREIIAGISNNAEVRLTVEREVKEQLGGYAAFDFIQMWADDFLNSAEKQRRLKDLKLTRNLSLLPRIKNNAEMLKGLFTAMCLRDETIKDELTRRLKLVSETASEKFTSNRVVELSQVIN
ncbi:MAG: hypothetical protein ACRD6Q_06075, partial [Nitrososphaeraceae archaeon]